MARALRDKHSASDTLGAYRLVSRIATTHACEVWEAAHTRSRKACALKILLPSLRGNRLQVRNLRHEYSIGRDLDHESIIRTDDFDVVDDLAFIAMEYFPAPNLQQRIQDESLRDSALVAAILLQAASALDYMHGQGIIHRDVKPGNFLADDEGHVKLIDFTLAKKVRGWLGRLFDGAAKTQGTLSYMSPEQIRNKNQDERADIYSFGCVVYELVCGRPPYTAESGNDLLHKHLRSPIPSAKVVNPNVTDEFSEIIKSLLAKEPDQRPASMTDVLRYLRGVDVFVA